MSKQGEARAATALVSGNGGGAAVVAEGRARGPGKDDLPDPRQRCRAQGQGRRQTCRQARGVCGQDRHHAGPTLPRPLPEALRGRRIPCSPSLASRRSRSWHPWPRTRSTRRSHRRPWPSLQLWPVFRCGAVLGVACGGARLRHLLAEVSVAGVQATPGASPRVAEEAVAVILDHGGVAVAPRVVVLFPQRDVLPISMDIVTRNIDEK